MVSRTRRFKGFTLIELMVTLTVILVLMLLALPSFQSFRQRSALRGTAEQALGFWNQARFEAAKRNQMVKVGVSTSGSKFCLGAAATTDPADTAPCDCFTAAACDVARFPADPANDQNDWRGVTYYVVSGTTPTLGAGNAVAVIEPKRAGLATASQAGVVSFAGPPGRNAYRVNLNIDAFGRAQLCESATATQSMSDYADRRCSP